MVPQLVLTNVRELARGGGSFYALGEDGSVWAWGKNTYGQLGDGTTESSDTPIRVMENAVSLDAGARCAFAIDQSGTLWGWGDRRFKHLQTSSKPAAICEALVFKRCGRMV